MLKKTGLFATLGLLVIALVGYFSIEINKRSLTWDPGQKLKITTSFYPLYFFTLEIAGDKADVYNITPAGAEPHDYEPTTRDIVKIEDSQLLILNGGRLEAWGDKIMDTLRGSDTTIVVVGEPILKKLANNSAEKNLDPHIWLSPGLAQEEVVIIKDALKKADPKNSEYYEINAEKLIQKLSALNKKFSQGLSGCKKRDMITSHTAFGHLARAYGLNQMAIAGLSPDADPSPQDLARIADFATKNSVKYIFFESLVSPKLAETIAAEVGAETLVLNPLEGLSPAEISQGKNYFSEMENNLLNLRTALECQ